MTSLKSANRRVGSLFAVAALVLATVTPGLVPAFASAAQVTERSVALSSSSRAATGVSYAVEFTSVGAAKAVVLDFCSNSPLMDSGCTVPTGFSVASSSVTGGDFAVSTGDASAASRIALTGTIAATTAITFNVTNVTNPANPGPLYVRIVTFDGADTAAAEVKAHDYVDTDIGDARDQGSAAASITDSVGVSGAVLETMTFCVSGQAIDDVACTRIDDQALPAPTLRLGQTNGDIVALDSGFLSEGSIYSQISTNAVSGAVVSLRSSAEQCGGLLRAGATDPEECHIGPALDDGVAAGQAKFGVKTNTAAGVGTSNGVLQPVGGSLYNNSTFALNYVDGDNSGVTGPFGDPFLNTNGAPASNMGMQITFGASIAPNTPAGLYSTDLSLIATGKF